MTAPVYPQIEAAKAGAIAELYAALAAVQAELPGVKKTRTAEVLSKEGRLLYTYDYADLADVSAAIMPLLGRNGLAFTTLPGSHDGKFGLQYWLTHASGARLGGFYEIDPGGGIQLVGGRITYARRYCLCAVTGVAAEEDVDARGDGRTRRPQQRAQEDRSPQRTAQRRTQAPAAEVTRPSESPSEKSPSQVPPPQASSLPPLPGEDEPDESTFDTPGTATPEQLTALWATFSSDYGFKADDKELARNTVERITRRPLDGATTKDLSRNEASAALETLKRCGGDWDKLRALLDAGDKADG